VAILVAYHVDVAGRRLAVGAAPSVGARKERYTRKKGKGRGHGADVRDLRRSKRERGAALAGI